MSNTFYIYLLTRLDGIGVFFITLSVVCGLVFFGYLLATVLEKEWSEPDNVKLEKHRKGRRNAMLIFVPALLLSIMTPSTKQAILIIAGGKTLDYVQSDSALQKIPYKATELILKKMDEYIDESEELNNKSK